MPKKSPRDFQQDCVRDLAWVIASPSLLIGEHYGDYCQVQYLDDTWWQAEYIACLPALMALDHDPTPLKQALAQRKTQRLGEHFECLVNYWLNISPNYNGLLQNYVLYQNHQTQRKTLGELDFIIQQQATGKIIHLEVAAKFYLARTTGQTLNDWYGANLNDQFSRKVAHIQQHQSQLAYRYADYVPYSVDESWVMLKGRLFYPQHLTSTESSRLDHRPHNSPLYNNNNDKRQCNNPKYGLNPNHLTGYWWFHQHIQHWDHLRPLPKRAWFAPLNQAQLANYHYPSRAGSQARPQAISPAISNSTQAECYVDTQQTTEHNQRLFIVPDHHWARLK